MKLNQLLTLTRENNYYTQEEVAKILGVSQATYARYENGKLFPSIESLCKIAIKFNVSLDYILGLSKNKTPYDKFATFNNDTLVRNLITLRRKANYTQKVLAQKLSCAHNTISMYEHGHCKISYDILIKLSKLYKIPTDYIVGIAKNND